MWRLLFVMVLQKESGDMGSNSNEMGGGDDQYMNENDDEFDEGDDDKDDEGMSEWNLSKLKSQGHSYVKID